MQLETCRRNLNYLPFSFLCNYGKLCHSVLSGPESSLMFYRLVLATLANCCRIYFGSTSSHSFFKFFFFFMNSLQVVAEFLVNSWRRPETIACELFTVFWPLQNLRHHSHCLVITYCNFFLWFVRFMLASDITLHLSHPRKPSRHASNICNPSKSQ